MKLSKLSLNKKHVSRKQIAEDMRYLQKKISGKSVYASINLMYKRAPKHKNRGYIAESNALRGY